jgi:transposase
VTECEAKLRRENAQLRQQAQHYQSLHQGALAKQQEQAIQIEALQAQLGELREGKLRLENIQLRQQANYYQSLHERALAKQQEQTSQIEALKAQLAEMQKRLFGRKGERACSSEAWKGKRRRRRRRGQQRGAKGHGRKCRHQLPAEAVVVTAPLDQQVCSRCGLPFVAAGTQAAHEEIEWEVRLVRKCYRCQRYQRTCTCPGVPDQFVASAPARLIPKGLLSLGTIIETLRLKFKYQMPLQRILGLGQDHGLVLSSGTVCGIWQKLVPLLAPLYLALVEATRHQTEWLMDETRWEVFEAVAGKASPRWWVWVIVTAISRVYLLRPSRGAQVPKEFFGWEEETQTCRSTGRLMVDRFASYKFLAAVLQLAFCWAHVRRDFLMFRPGADAAGQAWADGWIESIGELYRLNDARIELGRDRQGPVLPAPFVRMDPVRMKTPAYAQAQQALEQKVKSMAEQRDAELAQPHRPARARKILASLREHWKGLTLLVDHPEIPLDNNGAERAGRPAALGRKNYYGSGSVWSGELQVMMLTLFQTLALHGVKDREYLLAYLTACAKNGRRAPSDLSPWLPWAFKAVNPSQASPTARAP